MTETLAPQLAGAYRTGAGPTLRKTAPHGKFLRRRVAQMGAPLQPLAPIGDMMWRIGAPPSSSYRRSVAQPAASGASRARLMAGQSRSSEPMADVCTAQPQSPIGAAFDPLKSCCNVRICTRARTGRPGGGRRNPATLMRDPVALPIAEPRSGLPPRKVDFAGSRLTATIGSEDGESG